METTTEKPQEPKQLLVSVSRVKNGKEEAGSVKDVDTLEEAINLVLGFIQVLTSNRINTFRPEVYCSRAENNKLLLGLQIYRKTFDDTHFVLIKEKSENGEYKLMECPEQLIYNWGKLEFPGTGNIVVYDDELIKHNEIYIPSSAENAILNGEELSDNLEDYLKKE